MGLFHLWQVAGLADVEAALAQESAVLFRAFGPKLVQGEILSLSLPQELPHEAASLRKALQNGSNRSLDFNAPCP